MTVGTDDHRRLLHFFRLGCFDDVYDIETTQCCVTIFPDNTRTLLLDCLRDGLGQVFEVLRILDCLRRNTTENHIRRHLDTSWVVKPYTFLLRASSAILEESGQCRRGRPCARLHTVRNSEIGTSLMASGPITPDRLTEYRQTGYTLVRRMFNSQEID